MEEFFKYLTLGEDDVDWGLYVNVAGKAVISPGLDYPSLRHPSGYYFTWDKGRVLHEYQIVYVTEGRGVFEDSTGEYTIQQRAALILKPGVWHRYKPDQTTGWTEYYVGFNGLM